MNLQETPIEIIKELIQVHHDRAILYHQALSSLVQPGHLDLKAIFGKLLHESLECLLELKDNLAELESRANGEGKVHKGPVYKIWREGWTSIAGINTKSVLETCAQEIDALRKAYDTALLSGTIIESTIRVRLRMQMVNISEIESEIRRYHDAL